MFAESTYSVSEYHKVNSGKVVHNEISPRSPRSLTTGQTVAGGGGGGGEVGESERATSSAYKFRLVTTSLRACVSSCEWS